MTFPVSSHLRSYVSFFADDAKLSLIHKYEFEMDYIHYALTKLNDWSTLSGLNLATNKYSVMFSKYPHIRFTVFN